MADWKEIAFAVGAAAAAVTGAVIIGDAAAEAEARRKERLRDELKTMSRGARKTFEQVAAKPHGIKRAVFADEALEEKVIDRFRFPTAHAQLTKWASELDVDNDRKVSATRTVVPVVPVRTSRPAPAPRRTTIHLGYRAKRSLSELHMSDEYYVRAFAEEVDKVVNGGSRTFLKNYKDRARRFASREERDLMMDVLVAL
jgi:hypothetical protein